ncbi:MAG: LamG domain-containing protein, partial [Planctomycetota bacterium]
MGKRRICLAISAILVIGLGDDASADLLRDPALVIYYSFEEVSTIVADQSGNGYDGAVMGDITLDPDGKYNGAAKFTTGSYLDLDGPSIPEEDIPTSGMTLAAWIKCQNTGQHHAIFNARAADATWLIHPEARSNGEFRWLLRSYGGTTIFDIRAGSVTWDEWLHFAGTYDRASGKAILHINGQVVREDNIANPQDIAGDWGSGARVGYNIDSARPFTGLMDEFYLFKRALTGDEVTRLMEREPIPPEMARHPDPPDEATDVPRDVILNWTPGDFVPAVNGHNVYLSANFSDVNDGMGGTTRSAASHDPGRLEFDTTYYWRVDEVNAPPDSTVYPGSIWSFTTEPVGYPIDGANI